MVKLSQQINGGETQRVTRTDIVKSRQQYQKERREFDELKTRATAKQKEFEGIKTIDEYEQKYTDLDPSLKTWFSTPDTLRSDKTARIDATKIAVQEKIVYANERIASAKTRYDQQIQSSRETYARDKRKGRKNAKKDYRERNHEANDQLEEREAKWEGYKKGLNKGVYQLNQNKDVTFNDIHQYADDLSNYEENKKEASNKNRKFDRNKEIEERELIDAGYKPQVIKESFKGQPQAIQTGFYNPETKDWVSGSKYKINAPVDVTNLKR